MANLLTKYYKSPRARSVMYESDGVSLPEPINTTELTSSALDSWLSVAGTRAKSLINSVVHGATGIDLSQSLTGNVVIEFPNVQSLDYDYVRDVNEQMGIIAFALIPWYLKPVRVVIKGLTYTGAYSATDAETFIYDIKNEQRRLDTILAPRGGLTRTSLSATGSKAVSRLIVGGDSELDKLELYGVFAGVRFTESVDNGALTSYTATYIGVDSESYGQRIARARASS